MCNELKAVPVVPGSRLIVHRRHHRHPPAEASVRHGSHHYHKIVECMQARLPKEGITFCRSKSKVLFPSGESGGPHSQPMCRVGVDEARSGGRRVKMVGNELPQMSSWAKPVELLRMLVNGQHQQTSFQACTCRQLPDRLSSSARFRRKQRFALRSMSTLS